jgi:hypothetical protein
MPKQEEHERTENLVEQHHGGPNTARSMADAANSDNQLEGYASINGLTADDELARIALEHAGKRGENATPNDDDWFRAEAEVRRRRDGLTTGFGNDTQEDRSNK